VDDTSSASALDWLTQWWDDDVAMLWNPAGSYGGLFPERTFHMVPPTVWYALALLHRQASDDVECAVKAIDAVIACQLDEPGAPWHGTYARFCEFPAPAPGSVEYLGYDPNWRQFVGTGFCLALLTAGDILPRRTVDAMVESISLAVDAEPPERVSPAYSNIALMQAWLDGFAGDILDRPDVVSRGAHLAAQIVDRFDTHGTFDEWNSPTYYGIDLYALSLWRQHSPSPRLRHWGERLEAELWSDVAPWYHADLGNVAGPYTRAYGMDMRRYVAALGPVDRTSGGPAPVPDLAGPFSHSHDLAIAPVAAILGTEVPPEARRHLTSFTGERTLERHISDDPERIASAWLAPTVMIGAERGARRWKGWGQYHPATIHWQDPSGRTRWIRLVHSGRVDASATAHTLTAECRPRSKPGAQPAFLVSACDDVQADRWSLPGLTVDVKTNATFVGRAPSGDIDEIRYDLPPTGSVVFELTLSS